MEEHRKLAIVGRVATALNASVELDEALETTLESVGEAMGLETGWIWLLDPPSDEPYLAASRNLPKGLRDAPELMEGSCYCLSQFRSGELDEAANYRSVECSRLGKLSEGADGYRFHTSVPLYGRDDERIGVLNLAAEGRRELSASELELLQAVSDIVAMAVERTRLHDRSAQLGAAEERNRLARDIHDTIAQGLSAVIMQLESAAALLEQESSGDAKTPVERALDLSRQNLEEARRSVRDLRAAPLEDLGLADAVSRLATDVERDHGLTVTTDFVGMERPLPERIETGLYRVVQEALNNVAQHADARSATLRLEATPDDIVLRLSDDGRGMPPDAAEGEGWGLVGMRERVRRLGGQFQLATSWTEGTEVTVELPLEDDDA